MIAAYALSLLVGVGCWGASDPAKPEIKPASETPAAEAVPPLWPLERCVKLPIGPRGMELSEETLALDGQRVRVHGYMVRDNSPQAGVFLLTVSPMTHHTAEYGQADDLPPQTVAVLTPGRRLMPAPWQPGLLEVTGVLRIGRHELHSGRPVWLRIELEGLKGVTPEQQPQHTPAQPIPPAAPPSRSPNTVDSTPTPPIQGDPK